MVLKKKIIPDDNLPSERTKALKRTTPCPPPTLFLCAVCKTSCGDASQGKAHHRCLCNWLKRTSRRARWGGFPQREKRGTFVCLIFTSTFTKKTPYLQKQTNQARTKKFNVTNCCGWVPADEDFIFCCSCFCVLVVEGCLIPSSMSQPAGLQRHGFTQPRICDNAAHITKQSVIMGGLR